MSRRHAAVTLVVTALVLAGCSTEADDASPVETSTDPSSAGAAAVAVAEMAQLVGVLEQAPRGPGVRTDVTVVDLVAARVAAGAPADTDPLIDATSMLADAEPALGTLGATLSTVEDDAIDLGQATMAATIDRYGAEITALATDQAPAEVTTALPGLGFREAGDVWVGDGTTAVTYLSVQPDHLLSTTIVGDRGRQALRAVVAALASEPDDDDLGTLARTLLDTTAAPGLRMLPVASRQAPWGCLQAISTLESFTEDGGQMVFTPTGDPKRVTLPLVELDDDVPWATYRFGEPALLDNSWWVDVTLDESASAAPNSLLGFSDTGTRGASLVSCAQ